MSRNKEELSKEIKDRNAYLRWIFSIIKYKELKNNGRDYADLLNKLKRTKFRYSIERDENRLRDGYALREKYEYETGNEFIYLGGFISLLEVLVALSERIEDDLFEENNGDGPAQWFWIMMENCGLDKFTNEYYNEYEVSRIIDVVLDRKYSKSGKCGLFPLKKAEKNQRDVEIWYQMQAYILENYDF